MENRDKNFVVYELTKVSGKILNVTYNKFQQLIAVASLYASCE